MEYSFKDKEFSSSFSKFIDYDGRIFKLREGLSLDINISEVENYERTIGETLLGGSEPIKFDDLWLRDIILKKARLYGIRTIEEARMQEFSDKEISILKELNFGCINDNMSVKLKR